MAAVQAVDELLQKLDADNQPNESKQNDDDDQISDIASKVPSFKLNHPNRDVWMPAIGFGLYNIAPSDMERVVVSALQCGYRHFDGASFYDNEAAFGAVLRKHKIARNEVFVTSKVWNDAHGVEATMASFSASLKALDCEYLDLYLVHWPVPDAHCATWTALERLYRANIVRAIGVSNYVRTDWNELLSANVRNKNFITPSVNQLCLNPLYYRSELVDFFRSEHGVVLQAYKPLARASATLLENERVVAMSKKYDISAAQCCLKWGFQHCFVELVKSSTPSRIKQNMDALFLPDMEEKDVAYLDGLTTQETLKAWDERYVKRKNGM